MTDVKLSSVKDCCMGRAVWGLAHAQLEINGICLEELTHWMIPCKDHPTAALICQPLTAAWCRFKKKPNEPCKQGRQHRRLPQFTGPGLTSVTVVVGIHEGQAQPLILLQGALVREAPVNSAHHVGLLMAIVNGSLGHVDRFSIGGKVDSRNAKPG